MSRIKETRVEIQREVWGSVSFPGIIINAGNWDGPYNIGYVTISDSSGYVIYSGTNLYETQAYTASQFETQAAPLITATGTYSEGTLDHNSNSLIDSLVIEIEVVPRDSGNVVALGRLVDAQGETILWSSTTEFLQEKTPQTLHLKFDGRYIYGGQVNGPYELMDLQIYHAGDPSHSIDIHEPVTTQFYRFDDFEPAGIITGTVKDSTSHAVANAFLIVTDVDNDFSNAAGRYNIVALDSGEYVLKIEGPDTLDLDWSIYIEDEYIKTGDSIAVSVSIGQVTNVDFFAPLVLTGLEQQLSGFTLPIRYELQHNYPNPFNAGTIISYQLPNTAHVLLEVYNILGQKITSLVDRQQHAGYYQTLWQGKNDLGEDAASGVYIVRLFTGDFEQMQKMLLLR